MASTPPPVYPWPIGAGAAYHPTSANALVADGRAFGRFRCGSDGRTFQVHVELFARRQVVIVPPRIGIAGAAAAIPYERRHRPASSLSSAEDAGSSAISSPSGDVGSRRLDCSRSGAGLVYVNGRERRGDPRLIRLAEHDEIVIEVGGYVAPHPSYLFPKGGR